MLNVSLMFGLSRSLAQDAGARGGVPAGFAAGALLAVHPMMTEAVGYISGRFEVLCTTFFLAALWAGRRWLRGSAVWALPTAALWLTAVAAKETAVVFPVVLAAMDFFLPSDRSPANARRRLARVHIPLLLAAVLIGLTRLAFLLGVEYAEESAIHWRYSLIVLDVVRRYAWLLLNPTGQTMFHQVELPAGLLDPRVLLALAMVGIMAFVVWRTRRADPRVSVGLVWFLAGLAPSSVLILLDRGEPMAEHRVYLASCGLFIAAAAGIERLWEWAGRHQRLRPWIGVGAGLVLLSFAVETVLRNRVWASPVSLWNEAAARAPEHYRPRLLLGEALHDAGRRDEAIVQFQTAIRLRPTDKTGHVKLGQALAEVGRFADARSHFEEALQLDPADAGARHSLAVLDDMEAQAAHDPSRR
jgi:tetratricopeptide (TPR) repeat protein